MSDGKNLILGSIGKIKSFFSGEFGPVVGGAIGASLGVIAGIVGKLIGPTITGLFAQTQVILDDEGNILFSSLPRIFQPIADFFKITLPDMFSGTTGVLEGLQYLFADLGTAVTGFGETLAGLAAPVAAVIALVASLCSSYGGLQGVMQKVSSVFKKVIDNVKEFAKNIGFDKALDNLKTAFGNLGEALMKVYD